jgi:hypothetical protein
MMGLHKFSRDTHKSWRRRSVTIKSGLRYWSKWGGPYSSADRSVAEKIAAGGPDMAIECCNRV